MRRAFASGLAADIDYRQWRERYDGLANLAYSQCDFVNAPREAADVPWLTPFLGGPEPRDPGLPQPPLPGSDFPLAGGLGTGSQPRLRDRHGGGVRRAQIPLRVPDPDHHARVQRAGGHDRGGGSDRHQPDPGIRHRRGVQGRRFTLERYPHCPNTDFARPGVLRLFDEFRAAVEALPPIKSATAAIAGAEDQRG